MTFVLLRYVTLHYQAVIGLIFMDPCIVV